jgi:hypothetical protein
MKVIHLELGHQLLTSPVRTTEFAPALPSPSLRTAPPAGYAPPQVGLPWKAGRFSGQDFALQPDGTLRCPADQKLIPHEQRVIRRWEPARRVWSQYPQLSSLSAARAVPMAWQRYCEASPGERAPASAHRRFGAPALARLEPERASTRLYAVGA